VRAVRERHLRLPRRDHGLQVVAAVDERGVLARHQHEGFDLGEVGQLLRVGFSRHHRVRLAPGPLYQRAQLGDRGEVPGDAERPGDDADHPGLARLLDEEPAALHDARDDAGPGGFGRQTAAFGIELRDAAAPAVEHGERLRQRGGLASPDPHERAP